MHHRHHGRGRGPADVLPRRLSEPRELIERLEGFQRDLEQQLADIADVLTHLRDSDAGDAPQQQV